MTKSKARVVVATLRERFAMWEFIDAQRALAQSLADEGILEDVFGLRTTYLATGRNEIVRRFLQTEATHLFFLDSDVLAPPGAVQRLLASGGVIVSGLYFQRRPPYMPEAYRKDGETYVTIGAEIRSKLDRVPFSANPMILNGPPMLLEVDAVGAGCLLIARSVLEKMPAQPFGPHESRYGEDITFCRAAQEQGYQVLLDWSVLCGHMSLLPIGQAQFRAMTPLPGPKIVRPGSRRF